MGTTVKLTPADRLEDRIAEVDGQLANAQVTLSLLSDTYLTEVAPANSDQLNVSAVLDCVRNQLDVLGDLLSELERSGPGSGVTA